MPRRYSLVVSRADLEAQAARAERIGTIALASLLWIGLVGAAIVALLATGGGK